MFKSGKETKALLLLGCYKIGFALLCVGLLFASADQGWFNESQFERVFQKWPLEGGGESGQLSCRLGRGALLGLGQAGLSAGG